MNLIFIHFGTAPKHFVLNVEDTCERFPNSRIYVITDLERVNFKKHDNLTVIFRDVSKRILDYAEITTLPSRFRNGFWLLSLIRLEILAEFVIQSEQPAVHIESDVVISSDFPFDFLENTGKSLAYVRVSEMESIASIVFLKPGKTCEMFASSIFSDFQINPGMTDMKFLSDFQKKYSNLVHELPGDLSDPNPTSYIFDGSDFGQYLFGTDPRNARGVRYLNFMNLNTRVSPESYDFYYDEERQFLNIASEGSSLCLVNLHIHSKLPKMFQSSSRVVMLRKSISPVRRKWRLHLFVFLRQLQAALLRRLRKYV